MRTSNYKKIKFTKSAAKKTGLAVGAILLAGIIFFFAFFHVTHVEVMENTHYSKKELKKMILTGAFSSNSILAHAPKQKWRMCRMWNRIPSAVPEEIPS